MFVFFLSFFIFLNLNFGLDCFYCRHSTHSKEIYDGDDTSPECLSFEKFYNGTNFRRTCSTNEIYCLSQVTNVNGFFVEVRRDCADYCKPVCYEKGYGLSLTVCTRCCNTNLCNNYDGANYYRPNNSQIIEFMLSLLIIMLTIF